MEWLYLALGEDDVIHDCTKAECKVKKDDRFGFCYFEFEPEYYECKLVDLTISHYVSYIELNQQLENCIKDLKCSKQINS